MLSNPRLPAPKQLVIESMSEYEVEEMIERHIEFVDDKDRAVRLPSVFVRHYMKRNDGALPTLTSIAQLPIVLYEGTVLTGQGIDRKYGIWFAVPDELALPQREDCGREAVAEAMRFLTDDWLGDVAASYADKCAILALMATIIERALLPQRPAFFVTAGRRGNGKTTTLQMVTMAATGLPATAAAWSTNEEERRKALFSYLGAGIAFLIWDNIKKGTMISCSSVEKSLTIEFYSDRVLGFSEIKTVPTYTVQAFTGNNIGPKGELTSRSLMVRLNVDRLDPENRQFKHPNPVGWTNAHRGQILLAMYTILLGNPRRCAGWRELPQPPTRFKEWWEMVGSAIEHAAKACDRSVDFAKVFRDGEEEDEEDHSIAEVLTTLRGLWRDGFDAHDVSEYLQRRVDYGDVSLRTAIEEAAGKAIKVITPHVLAWRLKALKDNPVKVGDETLVLRYWPDPKHGSTFRVDTIADQGELGI
jgi:hypothetical protein